jgi:hypothetical protein
MPGEIHDSKIGDEPPDEGSQEHRERIAKLQKSVGNHIGDNDRDKDDRDLESLGQ